MVIYLHEKCTVMITYHFTRSWVLVWVQWFHEATIAEEKVGQFIVFDLVTALDTCSPQINPLAPELFF